LKNVRRKELTTAIRSANEGESVLHPSVAKAIFAQLRTPADKITSEKARCSQRKRVPGAAKKAPKG